MAEIAQGKKVWHSNRSEELKGAAVSKRERKRSIPFQPSFIEPMKALLVGSPPREGKWIYEIKFDGFRAVAFKKGSAAQLLSRNKKDFAIKFPEVLEAV